MIKLELSNSGDRSVIFGTAINISAKDACPAPSMNMMLLLDLESNLYLYTGSIQVTRQKHHHAADMELFTISGEMLEYGEGYPFSILDAKG